ncbi:MAG: xanthine dehydrogenase family protein molybdopterin-binding subunit [Chloroflexi bacterium]|nr:xanthine dehydrogenase family protein molybdopterin-binding subunit [Chloroflexota bacterium]
MTMTTEPRTAPVVRLDGREKVTGVGRYAADMTLTGLLHGRFRFADIGHARIKRIDTTRAKALPGVVAVITEADVPDVQYGLFIKDRRLFAKGVVRWEGEVVAAVAALTPEIAKRAVELIEIDYEPLPVITDIEAALAPGAPLIHENWESYWQDEKLVRSGNEASRSTIVKGDTAAALASADLVVKGRYVAAGSQAAPIEPRAILAEWRSDRVQIWSSTQVPFAARSLVSETLGLPENKIRVTVPHLGGGFGAKCEGHFEPQVAALARAARRPVKVVFSRRDEFLAPDHRREGMIVEVESGVMRDGTIVARRAQVLTENGAYSADEPLITILAAIFSTGPYNVPNVDITGRCAYTNTQPSGSVRAPGAPQAAWALEQHMDEIAKALDMDPVDLRRKNLLRNGDLSPTSQVMSEIRAVETLDKAAELIGWGQPLPDDEGIGIACAWWPSFPMATSAFVKINVDGSPTIITGAQECGTGAVMTLPILAGEILGIDPSEFSLVYQDTESGPWDGGAGGSQTLFNNGRAVADAAMDVRRQLLKLAADELEAAEDDIELADGRARVKGSPDRFVTIAALADKTQGTQLLVGKGSGEVPPTPASDTSACTGRLGAESFAAPTFGTHAVRVKVDRDTGVVRVLKVVAAHDSGYIVNKVGAAGQVTGGVVMGLGQALTEGTQISGEGRVRNAHLLDYKLQTMADVPDISVWFTDTAVSDAGPKGSKGVGEPPCIPTPGAVANAIAAATGARVRELPATPGRIWSALREGQA